MEADFSGYVTKAGLKCTDGRTIMPDAFKHQDKVTVPLVWQHGHDTPENVLGHAVLENRSDGVYGYGFFNDTPHGQTAKGLVEHKDIRFLSIYANQLVERAKSVYHGVIREVSLVLAGANPGAEIDFVRIAHGDGIPDSILEDEAVIYTGLELEHAAAPDAEDKKDGGADEASEDDATVQDVYDSLTDQQKNVVHYMIGAALEAQASGDGGDVSQSDNSEGDLTHKEGTDDDMSRTNVFDQNKKDGEKDGGAQHVLTHDAVRGIIADAERCGSLKAAVEGYALQHGIDNIEVLFPQARNIDQIPEFLSRRMEWVQGVLNGTKKSPFSRIRSRSADITMEEARALGYIKGNMKKEEFFSVTARTTTPTTVYKKQKLDRDDIIDITDFDVVSWMKAEMRVMLDEELARAVLIGDGRPVEDPAHAGEPNPDKIKDPAGAAEGAGVRAIINEHELYATTINIPLTGAGTQAEWIAAVESFMRNRRFYKGTGTPTFYTTNQNVVNMLLLKDQMGRRLYNSRADLASALMVNDIVEVEVLETVPGLIGIVVNLADYTIGTDKGGEINYFDFFDIDFNQYKYLYETRCSGALTKLKSALIIKSVDAGSEAAVVPTAPAFNAATNTITIPTDTNADYTIDGNAAADGSTFVVPDGTSVVVEATPASGKYFVENYDTSWTYAAG